MPMVDIMKDGEIISVDLSLDGFNHEPSEEEKKDMAFDIAVERGLVDRDDRLQVVILVWPPIGTR
jgi:hypothetical protein